MYIKFMLLLVFVINHLCCGESLDTRTGLKRLMPIDVSKLNVKSLHGNPGISLFRAPTFSAVNNHIITKSESKPLNIDLSALKLNKEITSTTARPESKSQSYDESKDYNSLDDMNEMDNDSNRVEDFLEYDYSTPLRVIPHKVYFNVWSPESPGYDALTDFLHEEYKTGRFVSNGKRDTDLYPTVDWIDNNIPIFPDSSPPTVATLCPYRLVEEYGLSCSQLLRLMSPQKNMNHINKRNMFLSKGWGPSGSYINIPSKFESNVNSLRKILNLAKMDQKVAKSPAVRDKSDDKQHSIVNSRRWSVPHLFGSY